MVEGRQSSKGVARTTKYILGHFLQIRKRNKKGK
jgi:hypothetical protein